MALDLTAFAIIMVAALVASAVDTKYGHIASVALGCILFAGLLSLGYKYYSKG